MSVRRDRGRPAQVGGVQDSVLVERERDVIGVCRLGVSKSVLELDDCPEGEVLR